MSHISDENLARLYDLLTKEQKTIAPHNIVKLVEDLQEARKTIAELSAERDSYRVAAVRNQLIIDDLNLQNRKFPEVLRTVAGGYAKMEELFEGIGWAVISMIADDKSTLSKKGEALINNISKFAGSGATAAHNMVKVINEQLGDEKGNK